MIELLQLAGQVVVVLLVYAFTWTVLRTGHQTLRGIDGSEVPVTSPRELRRGAAAAPVGQARIVASGGGGLRPGQPFHLDAPLTIGRDAGNDVAIDDGFLSARHARLRPPNLLTDLGSTNGTLVNGQRVEGTVRLRDGDLIALGSIRFRFEESR